MRNDYVHKPNDQAKNMSPINKKGQLIIDKPVIQSPYAEYLNPKLYKNQSFICKCDNSPVNRSHQKINLDQKEENPENCKITKSQDFEVEQNNAPNISKTIGKPLIITSDSNTILSAYLISFTQKTSKLIIKFVLDSLSKTDSKNILNYFFGKNSNDNFFTLYKENEISILLYCEDHISTAKKILDELMIIFINPLKDLKNSIAEVVLNGICRIGFKNTKKNQTADRTIYLIAISDNENDCAKEWGTFPMLISVSKDVIELSIIFAVNSKPGIIIGEELRKSLEFIRRVNNTLNNFSFVYDRIKGFFLFKTSTHALFPPCSNYHLPQILISEAVNLYTSYAHGLYTLYSEMPSNSQFESSNYEIQNLQQQLLKSLFITCKNRSKKPLILFSLLSTNDININSQNIQLNPQLLGKEKYIIEFLKTDELLNNVFQTGKIFIGANGMINYPKYIIEKNCNIKKLSKLLLRENPKYYEKLKNIAEKLLIGNLCFDYERFIENFLAMKGKVYYSFKTPLNGFFDVFEKAEINKKSVDFFRCFLKMIEGEMKNNMWNIEDLYLAGIKSDGEKGLINTNYYGIKIKKETITLPSKSEYENHSEASKNRILNLLKNLTAVRYRMNQSYYNEYVCAYLGLIDEYTIVMIDTNQLTIEESVEISKKNIEEEKQKNPIEYKEIVEKSIVDYLYFESKLKSRNLRLPSYIPTKVLIRNFQLGVKNLYRISENTLFHIIPMKELHICHNEHNYMYILTDGDTKHNENYSSRNSFYKNIAYYLTSYKEECENIDQIENLDKEILSTLINCRKELNIV
ncbi:hypothetical protein SteCoe_35202 [Stentor coeruleus]|uniref:Uncharacterized protein n=1 Tax=Stentor coeruleus TaxID=5963 RepID=A0A1R2AST9_9CILI|nr:hypothetical protein SteCoe_35202 [Stentor coeruleus]